ncbi:DUF4124 domain-containing protein [Catenovulum sp. SM1970]|uniref:DUF4124 domain-containing protein n=1 Tax=Marinifaba aquimaris TaxID=2741323 RepID=UPI0015743F29|nr:DUF4124 domain-containing protein [Marinifaba aquimaris]NTS75494.1 DUF4124 domain-containing protein [Marinifaba aquimaris]
MPSYLKLLSVVFIGFFFSSSHAAIYKWTDENGQVHFSERPIDEKSKVVEVGKGQAKRSPNIKANSVLANSRYHLTDESDCQQLRAQYTLVQKKQFSSFGYEQASAKNLIKHYQRKLQKSGC